MTRSTGYNSTGKKFAAQWLNEALYFASRFRSAEKLAVTNSPPSQSRRDVVVHFTKIA